MLPRMRRRASIWVMAGSGLWLSIANGCQRPAEEHVVQPSVPGEPVTAEPAKPVEPVLPTGVDVPVPGSAVAVPTPEPAKAEPEASAPKAQEKAPSAPKPSAPSASAAKQPEPAKPTAEPKPSTPEPKEEPAAKVEPVAPQPVEPAPAPAPEPPAKTGVKVPRTAHVRAEIPKGMQALLDADTRMQPWVDKAMAIVERCYVSKGFGTSATIVGVVTMHPNARPDVDVTSLPPTLAAVVACATGDLMRNRMPLFTGPEGQRHTLKIRFTP
jgi:hypothetical protein